MLKKDKITQLALYTEKVSAGFPSPVEGVIGDSIDLNQHLIERPEATFFVRVSGDSMINAGIHQGDILIVDKGEQAANNRIVIAVVDGDFTVKRLHKDGKQTLLLAENDNYPPIDIKKHAEVSIWGVVTYVIHKV